MEIPDDVLRFFRKYKRNINATWDLHDAIGNFTTWSRLPAESDYHVDGRQFWNEIWSMPVGDEAIMIEKIRNSKVFKEWQSKQKPKKARSVSLSIAKMRKMVNEHSR